MKIYSDKPSKEVLSKIVGLINNNVNAVYCVGVACGAGMCAACQCGTACSTCYNVSSCSCRKTVVTNKTINFSTDIPFGDFSTIQTFLV